MGYAYDREKNDKLESNDSESTYEEDVYDTLEKIRRNNITLKNNNSNQIERYISAFIDNSTRLSEYKKEDWSGFKTSEEIEKCIKQSRNLLIIH